MQLDQFVNNVKSLYGNNLEAAVLFGSAASGDFSKKFSDYNTIIVLKESSPMELAKSSKVVKKWVRAGNSIPLFFDMEHIKSSSDVFPIEFHDIMACRKVLCGEDPFRNIRIENTNLRHQCESELKGKLLQIQSRFVEIARKDKEISKLMMESLSTFLSIFKGIVRLLGHEPEDTKRALVEQLATIIDFNPNIFMELLDIREENAILPRKDAMEKFEDYLEQIKTVTNFVDKFGI